MNEEFMKIHGHKTGTPTLGGLMISVTVAVLGLLLLPASATKNVFLIFWVLYTAYGFADGMIVYARKLSTRFKLLEASFAWRLGKLGVLYILTIIALHFILAIIGIDSINLFGIIVPYTRLLLPIGAFFAIIAIYGMEITDGADGLVTGQFLVAIASYLLLAMLTGHVELLPILGLVFGSTLVYLYFNINPARVFMGGTGTFPIAFSLIFTALVTNTIDILLVVGLIFWIEISTSALQILSIKFLKRRLFRIAPIHHYFESIGWPETKMVQRFWWLSIVMAIVGLWIFSLTR